MGEVRIRVKLTNAFDEGLHQRGQLAPDQVRSLEVDAVIDTGAVRTVIPAHVADQLGLRTRKRMNARFANGTEEAVDYTEPAWLQILDRETAESFLVLGSDVLIGQTALEATDLLVDCTRQKVIPNPDHPNAPVIRIR